MSTSNITPNGFLTSEFIVQIRTYANIAVNADETHDKKRYDTAFQWFNDNLIPMPRQQFQTALDYWTAAYGEAKAIVHANRQRLVDGSIAASLASQQVAINTAMEILKEKLMQDDGPGLQAAETEALATIQQAMRR